ncbi:unnamed protein product [Zymoseptoria tritici ST99CH_1E4]|uniref:T6SS Phospholipase effector Tle1-like catalytic domain-containing protein n=1 Tax=Zymoseptoria tritici ST99CH_1E4 TaxID=1276532 RepID=A0A2H1GN75_ZYMTR|nr:unnamed protein product [Zymoseptoria tritici ST99CH_1E4]
MAQLSPHKRIILCADGTWLASDLGDKSVPSSVAKLARAISPNGLDDQGRIIKQIVSYHSGVGSGDLPFQKAIAGGIGWGLDADVTQIYDFISNNYQPGDELFFFGYSRGAFTVRSVAGLVSNIGVLSSTNMSHFPEMWRAYRKNTDGRPFKESSWYRDNKARLCLKTPRIKAIGVWETVGALGIPEWPVVHWLSTIGISLNKQYAFHDTKISSNVDYAFQALAIDEKRLTFPPTLWHATRDAPAIKLEQCWFPGVHSDVGGQTDNPRDTSGAELGYNTFAWMADNVSQMLTFEKTAIDALIQEHSQALASIRISNGWGCGKIIDNFSGLTGALFRLLGICVRTPGGYDRDPGDGTSGSTEESFHPIVRVRRAKVPRWQPPALKGFELLEQGKSSEWVKRGARSLPEYVLLPSKRMSVSIRDQTGDARYTTIDSMSRTLCPAAILAELDEANSTVNSI